MFADWDKACELIKTFDWDSLLSQYLNSHGNWHQYFLIIMAESIPNKEIRTKRNLPWLNKSIIQKGQNQRLQSLQACSEQDSDSTKAC